MADITDYNQQWRNDTSANLTADNPTPRLGEPIVESDTGLWKLGNGTDAWNDLAYVTSSAKNLGELFYLDDYRLPASEFPALCLNVIDAQTDLLAANWPQGITHLRARQAYYLRGRTGEKSDFDVTNWDVTSNVGTLTFANTTAENAMLTILEQDQAFHGSYTNWRSITLPSAIGNIPADDYAITNVDTSTREITFSVTASDGSAAVTAVSNFYPHRIAGSTTTARVFEADDLALISEAGDGSVISGYRHLDAMMRITGSFGDDTRAGNATYSNNATGDVPQASGAFQVSLLTGNASAGATSGAGRRVSLTFDNSQSTSPNPAKTDDEKTRPKGLGAFLYWWGGQYVA